MPADRSVDSSVGIDGIHGKSFLDTLDSTCSRLQAKQAQYSIKRLEQLDAILCGLESELDILIQKTAQ